MKTSKVYVLSDMTLCNSDFRLKKKVQRTFQGW